MTVQLPDRVYRADVLRVLTNKAFMARIDLDCGVSVTRQVTLADAPNPAQPYADAAFRSSITLVGGRSVLLVCTPHETRPITCRMFVADPIQAPAALLDYPPGINIMLLDVGLALHWLDRRQYAKTDVFDLINGRSV